MLSSQSLVYPDVAAEKEYFQRAWSICPYLIATCTGLPNEVNLVAKLQRQDHLVETLIVWTF